MKLIPRYILIATLFGLCACDPMMPATAPNSFNPRDGSSQSESPDFIQVGKRGSIPKSMLQPNMSEYKLDQGDKVDVELLDSPDTYQECTIMPDGMIYFHLADGVKAEGLTASQLTSAITEKLRKHLKDPLVRVTIKDLSGRSFYILGQVKRPGTYQLAGPTTLIDAISAAGGMDKSTIGDFLQIADLDSAYMVRNNTLVPVDFRALIERGDPSQNVYIESNDYIYIPSTRDSMVYVLGAVVSPRAVGYRKGLTLAAALAQAGGITEQGYREKVGILRGSLTSPQVAVVNFKDVLKGKNTNFALQSGDVVWVPNNPWELAERYLVRTVSSAAQALAIYQAGEWIDPGRGARATIGIQSVPSLPTPVGPVSSPTFIR